MLRGLLNINKIPKSFKQLLHKLMNRLIIELFECFHTLKVLYRVLKEDRKTHNTTDFSIDKNILPVVQSLNSIQSVQTLYSCQGHIFRRSRELNCEPYVAFLAPAEISLKLQKELKVLKKSSKLVGLWQILGYFDEYDQLVWKLEPASFNYAYSVVEQVKILQYDLEVLTEAFQRIS